MFIRYRTRVPGIMIGPLVARLSQCFKAHVACSWQTGLIRENGMQSSRDDRVIYLVPASSFATRLSVTQARCTDYYAGPGDYGRG